MSREIQLFVAYLSVGILLVAFPRFATVISGGIALGLALVAFLTGRLDVSSLRVWLEEPARRSLVLPFVALVAWSLLAAGWARSPADGLTKAVLTFAVLAATVVVSYCFDRAGRSDIERGLMGLTLGLLIASAYLVLETATERGLANYLFNNFKLLQSGYEKHLKLSSKGIAQVSDANLNRSTGIFCLLLWPAIAFGRQETRRHIRAMFTGGLVLTALTLLIYSRHQSSQLALLASVAAFVMASFWPEATRRLMATTLVAILVIVVPASIAAYKQGVHEAPWLVNSARQRVIVWNYTAEQIMKSPVIGIGTDSTHRMSLEFKETHDAGPKNAPPPEWRPHPHNIYLQVWSELGGIGAILFAWAGIAAIYASRHLSPYFAPFALAQAAMTFGMIATSYGLWQTWFQASVAIGALAVFAVSRIAVTDGTPLETRGTATGADLKQPAS